MIEFVDTHTHLFVKEFEDDRELAVRRAVESGVTRLCLPSIDETSYAPIMDMCDKFPGVCYGMVGLHPTEVNDGYSEILDRMYGRLKEENRFIAVGEIGIDLYWDDTRKEEQIEAFCRQLDWAAEFGLPVAIHSRNAFEPLYDVMESYRPKGLRGVFHCFSGTTEEAQKLLSFDGFYLGIGGVVTYKKSNLPEILATVPLERLLLETDSPYLAPVPHRGKRNESSYVPYVAAFLANLYNCPVEEVAKVTTANACGLFDKMR